MKTLAEILEETANRMQDVSVSIVSNFGTVTISDLTKTHDDIFLEGDDAIVFISEVNNVWEEVKTLTKGTIALALAHPYVENIWG